MSQIVNSELTHLTRSEGKDEGKPHVYLARDTRESSPILLAAVKSGLDSLGVSYSDFELLTTPQLHYLVALQKKNYCAEDYINNMTSAFIEFVKLCDSDYHSDFVLDCANGVGAVPMEKVAKILNPHINIRLINTAITNTAKLNEGCGAEFVHKEFKEPSELKKEMPAKCAAFDGDADRLMYFRRSGPGLAPTIVDGDKQFALLMMYIKEQLDKLEVPDLSHVLVHTAYANSRAT